MRFLYAILLATAFSSCVNNAEREALHLLDSTVQADSAFTAVTEAKRNRLEHLLDSLVAASFFYNDRNDFVHAASQKNISEKKDGFSIIVNYVAGNFYYVSKVTTGSDEYMPHNQLRFTTVNDTIWLTTEVESVTRAESGNDFEQVTFVDNQYYTVAEFVQHHRNDEIQVSALHYEDVLVTNPLTSESIQAIDDCILIANVQHELDNIYK